VSLDGSHGWRGNATMENKTLENKTLENKTLESTTLGKGLIKAVSIH